MSNPIQSTIDLASPGKHHGHLRLPVSRDESAWGALMIPITVIANGEGPTALLTGANHGDEYEGPVALVDLAQSLEVEKVAGRVIIIPFMNHPAFLAAKRTSPFDGGNMNRIFPGRPDGSASEKIANYFQSVLLPMADLVLDFHSGGKTLDFLPFAASHILDDLEQNARCRAARDAFNAPWSVAMREIDSSGMYDGAAEDMGKTFVTTELGGGGSATASTIAIAKRGVRNVLIHAGIVSGTLDQQPTTRLVQPDDACFHFAEADGLFEAMLDLGEAVREGQTIARIWSTTHTGQAPHEVTAQRDGIALARHHPGLISMGDCLMVLAVEEE